MIEISHFGEKTEVDPSRIIQATEALGEDNHFSILDKYNSLTKVHFLYYKGGKLYDSYKHTEQSSVFVHLEKLALS